MCHGLCIVLAKIAKNGKVQDNISAFIIFFITPTQGQEVSFFSISAPTFYATESTYESVTECME
jgi:hypothetical protein